MACAHRLRLECRERHHQCSHGSSCQAAASRWYPTLSGRAKASQSSMPTLPGCHLTLRPSLRSRRLCVLPAKPLALSLTRSHSGRYTASLLASTSQPCEARLKATGAPQSPQAQRAEFAMSLWRGQPARPARVEEGSSVTIGYLWPTSTEVVRCTAAKGMGRSAASRKAESVHIESAYVRGRACDA